MSTELVSYETLLAEFRAGMHNFKDGLLRAAGAYVKALDADNDWAKWLRRDNKELPMDAWRRLEKAGRGLLDHRLLLAGGSPAMSRLRGLPVDEQRQVLDDGVEVVVPAGAGETKVVRVNAADLDSIQSSRVFAPDHVRSVEEQEMVLAKERERLEVERVPRARKSYEVKCGLLVVNEPATFDREKLEEILGEME